MNTIRRNILILGAAFAFLTPAVRCEQSQKNARPSQEDRIKKLEDRADATEKAAEAAAMEKEYIARTQKLYESYYQRTLNTQLGVLAIVAMLLTAVFVLVARFSLNLFEQRTKLATADATAQLRNEYTRILAKEVQKLWDSNAADNRKLKEALTAQTAELERNFKNLCEFQVQFVQGIAGAAEQHHDETVASFRQALAAYKASKPRNLMEAKVGATILQYIFESLRKKHGEKSEWKTREELADTLYNDLQEELALTALLSPWLTALIKERNPIPPEPAAPEPSPAPEARPAAATTAVVLPAEPLDPTLDEESSCRLINS
jgi:hypothetical protein